MKIKLIAGCAMLSVLTAQLPGCSFSTSVESMLSPPRLTVEQEQIYRALQTSAVSQISLKYPKSGERLSAFIMEDFDGDGSDEAVVFYEVARNAADENPLRICLLDQNADGTWTAISHASAAGAEIDRVDLERLGTNPRMNLIISYSMVDGAEHAAQVFHYENKLVQSLEITYSVMELRDLNEDGTMEMFVASAAKNSQPAAADVYALNERGKYVLDELALPETMTDVSRITYGRLPVGTGNETVPAIYLDGMSGATSVRTVVLNYRENLTMLYADSADRILNTDRAGGFQTMDIDGDGEAEIPVNMAFYGYSKPDVLMTNWYVCRNGLLMRERSSYYSAQDGFVFLMPKRWERIVTARQENDEMVFYTFDPQAAAVGEGDAAEAAEPQMIEPLLRLAVVTDPVAADAMQSDGYLLLRQQDSRYYLGRIEQGGKSLRLSPSELLVSMRFLQ